MSAQQQLWHDSFEDAMRTAVDAVGGPKRVAGRLWANMPLADATRKLLHCIDPERPEKLTLHEVRLIVEWGRIAGCHAPLTYLARECGYQDPVPADPVSEQEKLQRRFIAAQEAFAQLVGEMRRNTETLRETQGRVSPFPKSNSA